MEWSAHLPLVGCESVSSRAERKRDKERDGMGGKERADFMGED